MDLVLPQPSDQDIVITSFLKIKINELPSSHSLDIVKNLILVIMVVFSLDLRICKGHGVLCSLVFEKALLCLYLRWYNYERMGIT